MQIGELARTTSTKVETIRFYEKIGLLPEPGRTSANYRDYGAAHLARLSFIRRARDLGFTLDQVREALESDDLSRFRAVVDALADEFELADVALAAVKLVHEASGATEDLEEIPDIAAQKQRSPKGEWEKGKGKGAKGKGDKPWEKDKGHKGKDPRGDRGPRPDRGPQGPTSRLYVGAGRGDGVRPQDLVGAIAGETHLRGNDIGAIRIFDRFALVEVPTDAVDRVIDAMKATTIRGKKAAVRRDRGDHD